MEAPRVCLLVVELKEEVVRMPKIANTTSQDAAYCKHVDVVSVVPVSDIPELVIQKYQWRSITGKTIWKSIRPRLGCISWHHVNRGHRWITNHTKTLLQTRRK